MMYLRFDIIAVDRFVESVDFAEGEIDSVDFAALQAVILMNGAHPLEGFETDGKPLETAPSHRQGFGRINMFQSAVRQFSLITVSTVNCLTVSIFYYVELQLDSLTV